MDEIFSLIAKERELQETTLRLIPSENYTSRAVREAVGSCLMHKYSEGQVGKRYYQGNEIVDKIERLCQSRALQAFGLSSEEWGVNVQALSGSPANLAVYLGLLEPGDRIMAMFLPEGGHLSHGWRYGDKKLTLVSKVWEVDYYHVDRKTETFDYAEIEKQVLAFKPKLLISGGTAYPREIDYQKMGAIAHKVGAYYLADVAHEAGLIAAGVSKSPFPDAQVVTMTTHKTLRGPRGALIFARKQLMEKIDRAVFPGLQGGPHNEVIAGIAVCLKEVDTPAFRVYAAQIVKNAKALAEVFAKARYRLVSGGVEKHLVLIDLRDKNMSGWVAAWALENAGIITNRNTVPYETASPFYPSGLRLGTPFVTTRGMKEGEMAEIGDMVVKVLEQCVKWQLPEDKGKRREFVRSVLGEMARDEVLAGVKKQVGELCRKFPLPE